jgi:hypothetical protein
LLHANFMIDFFILLPKPERPSKKKTTHQYH